jgi:hypothetical protein
MAKLPPIFNMDFEYPGFEIKVELIALQEYLKNLEFSVEAFCRSYIESEMKNYTEAEYHEYQHIYLLAEEEIPRIIRLPLVISIYTIYENSVTQLLTYAKKRENKSETLKGIKGKSMSSRFNKYLTHVLNYDFQISNDLTLKISELNKVRNCIAHANGNLSALENDKIQELKILEISNVGIALESNKIDVSYSFLESAMNEVEIGVRSLMEYMEHRYGAK